MSDRLKYNWISAASKDYDQALAQVFFLSNIHAKVLDVKLIYKELAPVDEVTYWCNLVLDQTESGLIQSLAALNQIIQGLNTFQGISILGVFKENVSPTPNKTACQQVHEYRDFLASDPCPAPPLMIQLKMYQLA